MTHSLAIRVYYEDTDAGGIVYHARYLGFAERARTEAMRAGGAAHDELATLHGLIFVVRRAEMDYLRPARLDDLIVVTTCMAQLGGASMRVRQAFAVGDRRLGVLHTRLACVRRADGRPAPIPLRWRSAMGGDLDGTGVSSA